MQNMKKTYTFSINKKVIDELERLMNSEPDRFINKSQIVEDALRGIISGKVKYDVRDIVNSR